MNQIKFLMFGITLCFFGFFPSFCTGSELSGVESAETCQLVTVASDISGEWIITPIQGIQFAKDTGGKLIYIVAKKSGEYTVIFFGVVDEKPIILQKPLTIADGSVTPNPAPSPVTLNLTSAEKTAAREALNEVIDGINDGSITTPAGARSVFKQALYDSGRVCNGRTCTFPASLQTLSDNWTSRTNFTSVETIKTSFVGFLEEVK